MEFVVGKSPHVKKPNARVSRMMGDVSIALAPLVIFAIFTHGLTAFYMLLAAVLSMGVTEYLYYQYIDFKAKKPFKLKNESFTLGNFTVLTSGLIFGLTLPSEAPILVIIISGVVGVFFAKLVFGGMGQNIFNIAGFARVFLALSYGSLVSYSANVDAEAGATVLGLLGRDLTADPTQYYSLTQIFTGIGLPGSLGETSALLILVGAIYLFIRKSYDVFVPLVYLGTVLFLGYAVSLFYDVDPSFPWVYLLSGGLMFGAIYMATDPVTMPVTRPGRIYYAFGLGAVTFLIRIFGNLPEGVVFAIVIMNMFVPVMDYAKWSHTKFNLKRSLIFASIILTITIITVLGVGYGI